MAYLIFTRPDSCQHGHDWTKPGSVNVSWVGCLCPGALTSKSGYGHHRVSCTPLDGEKCTGCWYFPAHEAGTEITGYAR